jgi:hypothetical protein
MPSKTNPGSNMRNRQEVLLWQILNCLGTSFGGGLLATEATLVSVLNAIIASDQDIEILLVRDTGNSDEVVQQITNYETGTPVVTYKDVNGVAYVPVGPLEYLDPSAVLNLILAEITAIEGYLAGSARTTSLDRRTDATGSPIAAGLRSVTCFNAGAANGTFQGSTIAPGESVTFTAGGENDTLPAITYDGTGTTLVISTVG